MLLDNHINHVVFVLDASSSMHGVASSLVQAADAEIAHLAQRSKEMGQETRVTVYVFSNEAKCVIYDMDVLRLPSIRNAYRPNGMTALVDASLLAIDDLAMTPEKYGDHAFLLYVFTDGQENRSRNHYSALADRIKALPDHWSLGVLVPNRRAEIDAARFGFPPNSIAQWDATTGHGVQEGVSVVRAATERFMKGREQGVRGTKSVFSTGADTVNSSTIEAADLKPLALGTYQLVPVVPIPGQPSDNNRVKVREFVQHCGYSFRVGMVHYQLTKPETIQPGKSLAVVHRTTGQVYTGPQVRALVKLPDMSVKVKPDTNPEYDIYVLSTSVNRKLPVGTRILLVGV